MWLNSWKLNFTFPRSKLHKIWADMIPNCPVFSVLFWEHLFLCGSIHCKRERKTERLITDYEFSLHRSVSASDLRWVDWKYSLRLQLFACLRVLLSLLNWVCWCLFSFWWIFISIKLFLGSSCIIERTSEGGICTKVKDCAPIYELFRQGKLRQAHNRPTVCSAPDKSVCCPQATSNQERATEEPENSRISGKSKQTTKCLHFELKTFFFCFHGNFGESFSVNYFRLIIRVSGIRQKCLQTGETAFAHSWRARGIQKSRQVHAWSSRFDHRRNGGECL